MTQVQWTYIYKLPVLLKPLKCSLHRQAPGESAIHRLPSHAILIATVTASLPEDQSARLFVNKTHYFPLPGWTDPLQLLLDPCHGADKKIHSSDRDDLLSVDSASIPVTLLQVKGRREMKGIWFCFFNLRLSRPDWISSFFKAALHFTLSHVNLVVILQYSYVFISWGVRVWPLSASQCKWLGLTSLVLFFFHSGKKKVLSNNQS